MRVRRPGLNPSYFQMFFPSLDARWFRKKTIENLPIGSGASATNTRDKFGVSELTLEKENIVSQWLQEKS